MASTTPEFAVPDKIRPTGFQEDPELLRHVKRPQWGLAILAWEREDRRGYQFEDGRLRTFKEGFYGLMKPADAEHRSEDAVIADLQDAAGAPSPTSRSTLRPEASFLAQVALFEELYPDGFRGEAWTVEHRGDPDGRPLKRHRDPVVEAAVQVLSAERIVGASAPSSLDIAEAALEVLSSTTLVEARAVKTLSSADEDVRRRLGEEVARILHGDEDHGTRFEAWLGVLKKALDQTPSWRFVTALPALVDPARQVCVRHSAFIRQAAAIAPTSRYSRSPEARSYRNFRRVAHIVHTRLEGAGHEPRDLLDVHDFIWATLRSSVLERLGT